MLVDGRERSLLRMFNDGHDGRVDYGSLCPIVMISTEEYDGRSWFGRR